LPWCATPSPASPRSLPRPTIGWRWLRNSAAWLISPISRRRRSGSRRPPPFTPGACTNPMEMKLDLSKISLREVNQKLHNLPMDTNEKVWRLINPHGEHACAVGLTQPIEVHVDGHIGYYCAGMNQRATVVIHGQCGVGVAENIMSGEVRVKGTASAAAAATGQGGLVVIEGDAGTRCGISMKGVDIVVAGSVGAMSAFMAQSGSLVVCGDAGASLGDSIYEAKLY